jgi:hypothetical protein
MSEASDGLPPLFQVPVLLGLTRLKHPVWRSGDSLLAAPISLLSKLFLCSETAAATFCQGKPSLSDKQAACFPSGEKSFSTVDKQKSQC